MTTSSFNDDLEAVGTALEADWPKLAGKRLFMTGGTGFIGRWMLEALRAADLRFGIGADVTVLTRDPQAFAAKAPDLAAHRGFRFIGRDVMTLAPDGERYDHVLHAATDASADLNLNNPLRMFDTVLTGTRRALDFAVAAGAERFFFFSSGAVYGAQPWEISHVAEDWTGAPDTRRPANTYAEAKRAAEMLCTIYTRQHGLDVITARIFALLGPLLSLDIHFAAGNFIRDALDGRTVRVEGAGTAVRSYLYAADLTTWLWAMLLRAPVGSVYNVGSEEAVSIAELAQLTATLLGTAGHEVLGKPDPGWNPGRYVPATASIRHDLGVTATVPLDEAIRRTATWNGWNR
jgi:dTDP-glucose 4,6-dehydratase